MHFLDLWQGRLVASTEKLKLFAPSLSDEEACKARSFKLSELGDRYVLVRGTLRHTLATYLDIEPAAVEYEIGEFGKPGLANSGLHFNLSHTGDRLLVAVSDMADIGVDIEAVRPRRTLDSLAERCFSKNEYEAWRQLAVGERLMVFYRLWTKKEAFVKAVGRGIAVGVERCEFALETGGSLVAVPDEYGPIGRWLAQELTVESGFSAAVVTPNRPHVLRYLSLDNS